MVPSTHTTPSGFLLPSIHSVPPFYTSALSHAMSCIARPDIHRLRRQQPNSATQATVTEHWTRLILSYARHRQLFVLRVEDAEKAGGAWDEILRNDRIHRRLLPSHLAFVLAQMVSADHASYEPPKQARSVLLHWRRPEEWAEVLHAWATDTAQLNTILTFDDIVDPPVPSPLSNLPIPLLRRAIGILAKSGRAQMIAVADGEGVRLFAGSGR